MTEYQIFRKNHLVSVTRDQNKKCAKLDELLNVVVAVSLVGQSRKSHSVSTPPPPRVIVMVMIYDELRKSN